MEAQGSQNSDQINRRAAQRMRALKGARIIFNGGYGVFDCTVRNLSDTGAMLQFSGPLGIPTHFDLELHGTNRRRPCTVRWRSEKTIGVSFDDASHIAA